MQVLEKLVSRRKLLCSDTGSVRARNSGKYAALVKD
jgi:hypothetical protein